ncbi:MAG TPA: phosphomannomutase CpsG [Steroidobacteraceae bacterium]|nr:phosphomannomutase CpsG [Steroidobacteraceae bacterium]
MTDMDLSGCFKAYDVRGRIPDDLNPEVVYRIGRAYAEWLKPARVAVGRDIRHSSAEFAEALMRGLTDSGVDVVDIGLCGTECVYFATFSLGLDGGVMVTASHNPPDYNGLKFVREQAKPVSGDTGLQDIRKLAEAGEFVSPARKGSISQFDILPSWRDHLLSYVDAAKLKPLSIVCNGGNGGAAIGIDLVEKQLPFRLTKVHHEPDGDFPNGVPNPMIEENREVTARNVRLARADLGIAFDGDFDRCFFFDEQGRFIDGYYIVGLLAATFLDQHRGAPIVHDPRVVWNTQHVVRAAGGRPVQCKSGHAFMKAGMRQADAVYGGEMSGHHYFRNFAYCDSGMIPWLVMAQQLSRTGKPLSSLVDERIRQFPSSGEINRKIGDVEGAVDAVRQRYQPGSVKVENMDGLSIEHPRWRFNLRSSNTEPLLRLNVESRGDVTLMQERTDELLELIGSYA